MDKYNILNKPGMLTAEDRKAPLERGGEYFTFKTCLDLSIGVKVIPYGNSTEFSVDQYTQDVAAFICFWNHFVAKDLNGFSGFSHVKFELVGGFKLIDTNKKNEKR